MKEKRNRKATSPVRELELELELLRRELRSTARHYTQRLERELLAIVDALDHVAPAEELTRDQLHRVRDFASLLRQRKLRPEKGRRKDLRKIDSLIDELRPLREDKLWRVGD